MFSSLKIGLVLVMLAGAGGGYLYVQKLQKDNMITIHNEKRWTHLTINNYDTYQDVRHTIETPTKQRRNIGENNIRMNKNEKNVKKSLSQKEQLNLIFKNLEDS